MSFGQPETQGTSLVEASEAVAQQTSGPISSPVMRPPEGEAVPVEVPKPPTQGGE